MTLTLNPPQLRPADLLIAELRASLAAGSQVITPADPDYDAARRGWNLAVDQHPAVIVVAQTATDVARAVRYARAQGLGLAVRATGHGTLRAADGGLLLVTSAMTDVRVNAAARTAWVSAGAKWGRVLAPAQAVGLAPLLGSTPDVGAVGYTLGGGMGWLARHYGLSTDSVNRFEVVTANGQLLTASASEHSDLFWALRGGGGNFGVVTGMEIRLYPVSTVYAGNLYYPAAQAREVFARYRAWVADAPDELTSSVVLMNFPPLPEMPAAVRGQSFVMVRGAWSGALAEGEARLKYWRDWQTPALDDFKPLPFARAAEISNDPVDPVPGLSSGAWLQDLSDETAETLIRYTLPQGGPPALMFAEVRHAGGAIARVDPAAAAYGNRDAQYSLQMVAFTPTPAAHAAAAEHVARMKQALAPHLHGGVYLNFLEGDEARAHTRQGYRPENFRRLQAVKARYDPLNLFSYSYDIPPAAEGGR